MPEAAPAPATYVLPPSKGRRPAHNAYTITRPLTEGDVDRLWAESGPGGAPAIKALRYNHHLLARLVAQGKSLHEITAITGMSATRVSTLKGDPTFSELVSFYVDELSEIYVDVHGRMAAFGISVLEELQERFELEPEKFTKRELMELYTTMADRSIPTAKGGPAPQAGAMQSANGLALQINFVSPPTAESASGPEHRPRQIEAEVVARAAEVALSPDAVPLSAGRVTEATPETEPRTVTESDGTDAVVLDAIAMAKLAAPRPAPSAPLTSAARPARRRG